MTLARLTTSPKDEYEIMQITKDGEWVLRDVHGDVRLFEDSERERVEVRCDFCRRWVTHAAPAGGGAWMCYGGVGRCD